MKFYSEKTKKLYSTSAELEKDEKALSEKEAEKNKLSETKKLRATEVEKAYKEALNARKEARELIKKADDNYEKLKDDFVKDFGCYHMTYSSKDGEDDVSLDDLIDSFVGSLSSCFPIIW